MAEQLANLEKAGLPFKITRKRQTFITDGAGYIYLTRDANVPVTTDIVGCFIPMTPSNNVNLTNVTPYIQDNGQGGQWITKIVKTNFTDVQSITIDLVWYEIEY